MRRAVHRLREVIPALLAGLWLCGPAARAVTNVPENVLRAEQQEWSLSPRLFPPESDHAREARFLRSLAGPVSTPWIQSEGEYAPLSPGQPGGSIIPRRLKLSSSFLNDVARLRGHGRPNPFHPSLSLTVEDVPDRGGLMIRGIGFGLGNYFSADYEPQLDNINNRLYFRFGVDW